MPLVVKSEPCFLEFLQSNTPIRSPDNNDDACESLTIAIADEHIGAVIGCGGRKIREIIQVS
jgi:RNA-binding protein Nova